MKELFTNMIACMGLFDLSPQFEQIMRRWVIAVLLDVYLDQVLIGTMLIIADGCFTEHFLLDCGQGLISKFSDCQILYLLSQTDSDIRGGKCNTRVNINLLQNDQVDRNTVFSRSICLGIELLSILQYVIVVNSSITEFDQSINNNIISNKEAVCYANMDNCSFESSRDTAMAFHRNHGLL